MIHMHTCDTCGQNITCVCPDRHAARECVPCGDTRKLLEDFYRHQPEVLEKLEPKP